MVGPVTSNPYKLDLPSSSRQHSKRLWLTNRLMPSWKKDGAIFVHNIRILQGGNVNFKNFFCLVQNSIFKDFKDLVFCLFT